MIIAVRAIFITAFSACYQHIPCATVTYASSNSRESLRNAFLHFLHTKVISKLCIKSWSAVSWWHSAQSNHLRPTQVSLRDRTTTPHELTARRAYGDLGVEDVLAAEHQRGSFGGGAGRAGAYHMAGRAGYFAMRLLRDRDAGDMGTGVCSTSVPAFGCSLAVFTY